MSTHLAADVISKTCPKINIFVKHKNQVLCVFLNNIMFHREASVKTIKITCDDDFFYLPICMVKIY